MPYRISSANIHRHTRVSSRPCAQTSTNSTNRRPRLHSSGLLESTPTKSTMLTNSSGSLSIRSQKNHTLSVAFKYTLLPLLIPRTQVQLQTLTAVVKLFLKKPDSSQGVVQRVLNTATKDCDSPDVRDRAYIYWRLLSSDPASAKVCFTCARWKYLHTDMEAGRLSYLPTDHRSLYHKPRLRQRCLRSY